MCAVEDFMRLNEDFDRRIKHDFRKYVFLVCSNILYDEAAVLRTIYNMNGYRRHRTVKCGNYTSHILVMYEDEYDAREAIASLNIMNCGLTAVLCDDMLRSWFFFEVKNCPGPACSLAIIDIIGDAPCNVNFLRSNILKSIFKDFGSPHFLPYTAALKKPHMQFVFYSMTEALAACMAFGVWYCVEDKVDCFSYRVRINPSRKEENLIRKCGGTGKPLEAFKLGYFVVLNKAIRFKLDPNAANEEKELKKKTPLTKEMQKLSIGNKQGSYKQYRNKQYRNKQRYPPEIAGMKLTYDSNYKPPRFKKFVRNS